MGALFCQIDLAVAEGVSTSVIPGLSIGYFRFFSVGKFLLYPFVFF